MSPTLTGYATSFSTSGSPKTVAATWATGDLLVLLALTENNDSSSGFGTPTFGGGTFTSIDLDTFTGTGTHVGGSSWQCTATSSGSGNISQTNINGSASWGFIVIKADSGTHNGIGLHGNPNDTALTQSVAVTSGSGLVILYGDWNGEAVTGYSYTPAGSTEITAAGNVASHYTWFDAYWNNQSGTTSYGFSGVTGTGQITRVYVEIKAAGGTDATVIPPARVDVLLH